MFPKNKRVSLHADIKTRRLSTTGPCVWRYIQSHQLKTRNKEPIINKNQETSKIVIVEEATEHVRKRFPEHKTRLIQDNIKAG